ncbi:hypothetical protein Poli38472_006402 [Pythium oligandrum]|uniref:TPR-like protein n=1 Tax=Pythium oligandrum TaxID=41045 RepID=A0A8K1C4K3_PYTOL|nr:hypothetical protein Poli38472_006402 [Pythium oligandrum]|eukprot:TMW56392.1 hypothetical protein Poli38472_006402 [Pythium oligandrum]
MAAPGTTVTLLADVKSQGVQQAVDFYQKGTEVAHNASTSDEYTKAIEYFSVAIAIRNDQPRFFLARGNAFRAINEWEYAKKDYTHAIALDDRTALYYANRGACHRKLNQPVPALEDFSAAIEIDSKKAHHYFNRAQVLYESGFHREAIMDFSKTLEEGSAGIRIEYRALQQRGNCYRRLGQITKCIDDLQRAIQLDSRNSTAFSGLAQAFMDSGAYDQAIENFSNAIQLNNSQASYFTLRGLCYYRKGAQYARVCLSDLNQSIKLDGKDPTAYFYRGSIRLSLALDLVQAQLNARTNAAVVGSHSLASEANGGLASALVLTADEQLEASFADIEMAWTLVPSTTSYQLGVAMITQLRGQYEAAAARFEEMSTTADQRSVVIVKYHWALCCHMLEDAETALTLLCDCVDAIPDEALFYEARSLVLQETENHAFAIADLTRAMELRATDGRTERDHSSSAPRNLYLRAESHLRLEHFENAINDCNAALSCPPHTIGQLEMSIRNTRAMGHRGLGHYDDAISDLSMCLMLAPSNDVFHFHRALCQMECEQFLVALTDLHAAIAANPRDAYILYSIGLCYYHEGENTECIAFMQRALKYGPPRELLPDLHYRIGLSHTLQDQNIPAIEHFTHALDEATKQNTFPFFTQAMLLYVHERAKSLQLEQYHEEAIEDFTVVIRHNPNNAHAYFRRGFALKALGRVREAASDIETAKLLDPSNPRLVVNYNEIKDTECIILCEPGQEKDY